MAQKYGLQDMPRDRDGNYYWPRGFPQAMFLFVLPLVLFYFTGTDHTTFSTGSIVGGKEYLWCAAISFPITVMALAYWTTHRIEPARYSDPAHRISLASLQGARQLFAYSGGFKIVPVNAFGWSLPVLLLGYLVAACYGVYRSNNPQTVTTLAFASMMINFAVAIVAGDAADGWLKFVRGDYENR
jgi:hypothetical protein